MKIREYCLGASLLALGWCGASSAQSVSTTTADTGAGSADKLPEVVVTGERRKTDAQVTPISATVVSGEDLANRGVTTIDDLQFIAPGATVNNFGQGNDFDIRGIGKGEHNSQTTVGVVTYRDGVATPPGYFQEEPYYDIANLEILRGPQGTFGGQNAIGGAVFLTTVDPKIGGGFDGYTQVQLGNYSDYGLQGAINLPISDTLAARAAFNIEDRDSFYSITGPNGTAYTGNPGNLREYSMRLGLLWKPTDALSVLWKTDLNYVDMGAYPADPFDATEPLFDIGANSPQKALDRIGRSVLKIDYQLPDGITIRSVSGYQRARGSYVGDLDGTNGTLNGVTLPNAAYPLFPSGNWYFEDEITESILSEEIDVISPEKGPVTWIVGAYADRNAIGFLSPNQFIIGAPGAQPPLPRNTPTPSTYLLQGINLVPSYSAFGQVSFNLTSKFQVQAGARYTESSTSNNVQVYQYGLPLIDQQSATFVNTSGKVSLNYTLNDRNFLYGFVSTGFNPGGLNVPVGLGNPAAFGAEKLTDYELGWKATNFGGHLRTQIDGFYYVYRDFQVTVGYPLIPTFGFELNDPNASHLYGFEAQAQAAFGQFSFDFGTTIMHSELGRFFASDSRFASATPCDPSAGPTSVSCVDLEGHPQTYAPNFTFNIGTQYVIVLSGQDSVTPRLNYAYIAPQFATLFDNDSLGDHLSGRGLLGAQLAWTHNRFVTTLYGTNLTNLQYVSALNSNLRFAGAPRQFGVRLLTTF